MENFENEVVEMNEVMDNIVEAINETSVESVPTKDNKILKGVVSGVIGAASGMATIYLAKKIKKSREEKKKLKEVKQLLDDGYELVKLETTVKPEDMEETSEE